MNDVNELRDILFDAIRRVKAGTLEIDKAESIRGLSAQVIETAKVEVAYLKATGGVSGTGFIAPAQPETPSLTTATGVKSVAQLPGGTKTTHTMRG